MPAYINPGRRIPVDSSQLHSLAFDVDNATLDVWFKGRDGAVKGHYRYAGVTSNAVCRVLFASSQGEAFADFKALGLPFQKVAEDA